MLHDHTDQHIEPQQVRTHPSSFLRCILGSSSKQGILIMGLPLLIIVAVVLFLVRIPHAAVAAHTGSSQLSLTGKRSPTPTVSASPLYLQFSALQGNTAVLHQVITIKSNVHKIFYWRFSSVRGINRWFTIAPVSGKLIVGQPTAAITVSVASSGLSPGRYSATVALLITDSHNKIIVGGSLTSIITLVVIQRH